MGRPEHKPCPRPDTAQNSHLQVCRCRDEIRASGFRATLSWSISTRGPGVPDLRHRLTRPQAGPETQGDEYSLVLPRTWSLNHASRSAIL